MIEMQTHPTTPASADTSEDGSIEAAALALTKRANTNNPAEVDPAATANDNEDLQGDDPNAEADDGQTDEDNEAEFESIEVEGVTLMVPKDKAEDVKKGVLRQADYSRKMNDAAALEKRAQAAIDGAEKLAAAADRLATVKAQAQVIDDRLKAYEKVDWPRLRTEAPAEYAMHATDMQSLRIARQTVDASARTALEELEQSKATGLQAKRAEMFKALETGIKGWSDSLGGELTDYATANGVSFETLSTITDPGVVIALHKARQFDELQKSKVAVLAKAKAAPPMMKPGAPRPANRQVESVAQFNKTRSTEDAIAALGARFKR